MRLVFKHVKRSIIFLIGGTILCIGAALLILPGPGIPILIVGLAILATEFVWAENILARMRSWYEILKIKKSKAPKA